MAGMAAGDIYRKSERGAAEVKDRKLKLVPRVRTMLILIDGTIPEFMLREDAARVGAPADFLEQLIAAGLVERVQGTGPAPAAKAAASPAPAPAPDEFTRFREAKNFMNTTIVDALGIKSFFFTMKLERAGTVADLRELEEPYREAMAKAEGWEHAAVMAARLKEMLG
jgi:hypothetical protein